MSNKSKKGSVFIQGWFVFLYFIMMAHQYQLNRYYYTQALQSLTKAKQVMHQHVMIIEQLRQNTLLCNHDDIECFTQEIEMEPFHYFIQFNTETRHVIEIIITNR